MPHMSMKQARALRDGTLKGDSNLAKAWRELIEGGATEDVGPFVTDEESTDTAAERAALGIPPRVDVEEDTEGW